MLLFLGKTAFVQIWQQLILQLKEDHSALSPADRAQLLDDAFSLYRAGILNKMKRSM